MSPLAGKLILITGGAKNVGRAIALELAARGAHILLNYFHSHDAAKEAKAELEAIGARVDLLRASVAQERQVERMFDEIRERYGYLDVLVNNAASGALVPLDEITEEHLDKALNTNFKGSLWCARRAAPLMAKRGGGSIINLSALGSSSFVMANYVACGPAKAAVESLTRYLAVELAPLGVRVNTASAGMLESQVANSFPRADEMQKAVIASTPLGRLGRPADFARLVAFLASDDAAWITGQVVVADGGLSLGSPLLSPPRPLVDNTTSPVRQDATSAPQPQALVAQAPATAVTPDGTDRDAAGEIDGEDDGDEIAIVGMGLVVPGANSPEEFWEIQTRGGDFFIDVPLDRWDNRLFLSPDHGAEDKTYQNKSAFVTGFTPCDELRRKDGAALEDTEFTTRWLRHSLLQALRGVKRCDGDRYSFIVGYTADGSQHLEEAAMFSGTLARCADVAARLALPAPRRETLLAEIKTTLAERFGRAVKAPSRFLPHRVGEAAMQDVLPRGTEVMMIDTACSSSLYAIDIGMKGLLTGRHDIALCGGAFALAPRGSVLFAKLHGISTSGEVRAFDKTSDGVLFADGAGVVVLKKLRRARRDGDTILAIVKAFGASSDGKGKAIYAPSSAGQKIAIDRALSRPGVEPRSIDWIIAHATGTPAGDLAEFTTLRQTIDSDRPVYVTSNKSLIGHTGWAAGVVSVIQAILGLQHQQIPPQHRFNEAPATFDIANTKLAIPRTAIPWPVKPDRARTVSISGFGFGGTNAHLLLEEYTARTDAPTVSRKTLPADRIAIVAWSAHMPGLQSRDDVAAWLSKGGKAPAASFGTVYPTPAFDKVRMPPGTIRTIDRCQLMILECAHELRAQVGGFWEQSRQRTGIFLGHMGATRNAVLYGARCYVDAIRETLSRSRLPEIPGIVDGLATEVRRLVPASNEDSFPGSMPNVIPARIANYFDLKGPNMTVDTGFSSTLSAMVVASRYLRANDIDLALVGGINGNSTAEMQHIAADLGVSTVTALAEGAVLFGLVTETTARESGLDILGYLDDRAANGGWKSAAAHPETDTASFNYLGAEGALHVLRTLLTANGAATIPCGVGGSAALPDREPRLSPAEAPAATAASPLVPGPFAIDGEYEPGKATAVRRYVAALKASPLVAHRPAVGFLPARTVVLTDRPELVEALEGFPPDVRVIATPASGGNAAQGRLAAVTPEAVAGALRSVLFPIEHVRVVTTLGMSSNGDCWSATDSVASLHELTFLVLKERGEQIAAAKGSVVSMFLDAVRRGTLHPIAGLFSGLTKVAAFEMPDALTFALFTDATDANTGARQAVRESSARRLLPVVAYEDDVRKAVSLDQADATVVAASPARLSKDSIVVAVGGARGITAEILKAVARHFRPEIYLIGSNPIDTYPPEIFDASDEQFAATRPQFIRDQKARHPQKNLGRIDKEFSRMLEARAARRNIEQMQRECGAGRVVYVACDVRDRSELQRAFDRILAGGRSIDLLINAAGVNRSAPIATKAFDEFLAIRDLKLAGYVNLKAVLKNRLPRTWCNFGSLLGFTGQVGEADYASGNDLLATSAQYSSRILGQDEYTIGWTLWGSVGLGAKPLTKAYFEKAGLYSNMATGEGIYHFIRELHQAPHAPSTVHIGAAEFAAIDRLIPGFFDAPSTPEAKALQPFYLGRVIESSSDEIVFERVFDLETDAYLDHHQVNGYATLPGTFVTEIAAEAAARLTGDLEVVAFEDIQFHHFLRVYSTRSPAPKRIRARIVEQSAERTVVRVRISADVTGPGGRVLVRDKVHFELSVVLASRLPQAPIWPRWPTDREDPVPDPYHFAAAPVLLTGMFASTTNTCVNPLGKRAQYRVDLEPHHPVFSRFRIPCILLDGLARTGALEIVNGNYMPLVAPRSIRRIDVYERTNDCALAGVEGIELYAAPRELDLVGGDGPNRCVAARRDGRMIAQIKDIAGVLIGYIDKTTGAYVTALEVDTAKQSASGLMGAAQ